MMFSCTLSFQDTLLALAKAVANATAALVLKAKGVASRTDDQATQNRVIGSATNCALSTSQLVACTKVSTHSNRKCTADHSFSAKSRWARWVNNNFKKAPFWYSRPLGLLQ